MAAYSDPLYVCMCVCVCVCVVHCIGRHFVVFSSTPASVSPNRLFSSHIIIWTS